MNPSRTLVSRSLRVATMAALGGILTLGAVTAAQETAAPHPAHIHSGTCATLGDVVVPLTDIAPESGERSGPASAIPLLVGETTVDMPLQEIIDGGHAINIHKSAEEIDVYIACGDIGGVVNPGDGDSSDELLIGIGELNDSGYAGVAWFGARGDQTIVDVQLIELGEGSASTAQSAEAAPAAAGESVAIKDFTFNPPTINVPVGGSVTWTNQDTPPHTATGLDREALQSGAIAPGASFTQAFDTAGTIEYFCEFHPNMKGSIVVE